jgi:uncharacterized protein YndB with AHSA1/START domain
LTKQFTDAGATHASFSIERSFKATPARVFAAWATAEARATWFVGGSGWTEVIREFDFREGGRERVVGRKGSGTISDFRASYVEIISDRRIVFAYEMILNDVRISVSLATIELWPEGKGARMRLTEQGAYLCAYDPQGDDNGSRERGTHELVDNLARYVDG